MDPLAQDERIGAYLDGELPGEERTRFEEEMARNAELRQLVEELRSVRASMQTLPQHRLENDFAERVLRRAERQMLTAQPIVAEATATPPVGGGHVTPAAARELVSASASSRHWRSWRPLAWSAIALSVAAILVAYDRGRPKGVQVAMDDHAVATREGKSAGTLPTGNIGPSDDQSYRKSGAIAEQALTKDAAAKDAVASGLGRPATDKVALDRKALEKQPGPQPTDSSQKKENEAAARLADAPVAGAAAAPALASQAAAPSASAAPVATAPGANLHLNSAANAVVEAKAEGKGGEPRLGAAKGSPATGGLVVVQCAAAPDVPRQAFQHLLAQRGIAFYDAPPQGATFAAIPAEADSDKSIGGAPYGAAGALPPTSAPALRMNRAIAETPPAPAKQMAPAAPQPASKPAAPPPVAAPAASAGEERKAPAEVDRLQAASAPPDDVALFYVEGTPEQVLGLVSDLRSQPVVYRSLAVNDATTSPLKADASKRAKAPAKHAAPMSGNNKDVAAVVNRAMQRALERAERQAADSGSAAWAVQVGDLPPVVVEKLKETTTNRRGELAKSDDELRQRSPRRAAEARESLSADGTRSVGGENGADKGDADQSGRGSGGLAAHEQPPADGKAQFGAAANVQSQRDQPAQKDVEAEQLWNEKAKAAPSDRSGPEPPRMRAVIMFRLTPAVEK